MRKVLCSIGAGPFGEILDRSGATFEIYARRHGYDLDVPRERPFSYGGVEQDPAVSRAAGAL